MAKGAKSFRKLVEHTGLEATTKFATKFTTKFTLDRMTVTARVIGRRKPLVPDWQLPFPPDDRVGGQPVTLRQLITRTVLKEVEAFKERQEERRLVRILTERQIQDGMAKGKVDLGGRDL